MVRLIGGRRERGRGRGERRPLAALLAGLGLLAIVALAARAVHVPIGGHAARNRWHAVLDNTRAARSEVGEALPFLLILLLALTAIVLWILTT